MQACFGDLLLGILQNWQGKKELALALDASNLGERFTSLNVSVMYRGCGIPVAWMIIPAHQKGKWRPYWERLLQLVGAVVPKDWKVIVMADRGLYAAWLDDGDCAAGMAPISAGQRDNGVSGRRPAWLPSDWESAQAQGTQLEWERNLQ